MVVLAIILVAFVAALAGAVMFWKRGARRVGTPPQRATYEALHTASVATSALRNGLTASSAIKAAPALRQLLANEGSERHSEALRRCLDQVLRSGRSQILSAADLKCDHGADCLIQAGVTAPIAVDGSVVGALAALASSADAVL